MEKHKLNTNFKEIQISLNAHIKRMIEKERLLSYKLMGLSKKLQIDEPTMAERIRMLRINKQEIFRVKKYRIKSKLQSYDIRDCGEYYGVLELEK